LVKATSPEKQSKAILNGVAKPAVVLAIRRLDTCNGITQYFLQVATHFHAIGSPVEFLIGSLIHYPGTDALVESLRRYSRRLLVGRSAQKFDAVPSKDWGFLARLAGYCVKPRGKKLVINTHSVDALACAAFIASLFRNLSVVHTFQLMPGDMNISFLNTQYGRWFITRNRKVAFLAISSEITRTLTDQCGVDASKVQTINYGVDTTRYRPPNQDEKTGARQELGVSADRICITVVARLHPVKGQDLLAKAISTIPHARERLCVICVGHGDPHWLRSIASEYGLDGIFKLLGHSDPLPALWASDFFVLPSNNEGFAICCIEAMACGLPVIRTNTAGAADQIVQGGTGFIVPVGDTDALAHRISELADKKETRKDMGRNSRKRAESLFKLETQLERTRLFFQSVVA
jgi:glycosyltransferase involved in cell wall biosynthesis